MGCAESRNTVQPHSAFSVVTPGSGSSIFYHNAQSTSPPSPNTTDAKKQKKAKHKTNTLLPEPRDPAAAAGGSGSEPCPNAQSTSPSAARIANAKGSPPTPASPTSAIAPLVKDPSLLLPPTEKQNLQHLTFEELSIQFLKAVKNGDLAAMEHVAQQSTAAAKSKNHPMMLLNIRGMWESTPLIYACQYCHPEAAMWLMQQGANVHLQNEKGVTPLLLASLEGMADVVDWILKKYAEQTGVPSSHGGGDSHDHPDASSSLSETVNIDKQVGVVYNSAADLNIRLNPLLAASMNGHVEIVVKLLAQKASVNLGVPTTVSVASSAKQFALLLAAKYGHASVVRILIKHGADFATRDTNCSHALLLACEAGKEECAMELLRLLPTTTTTAPTAEAVDASDSTVPPLIPSNSYITAWKQANCHGLTALHFAAANGLVPVVQSMVVGLQWGRDRDFLNATSVTRRECALLMACRKRQREVVQLLIAVEADFELADRGGTTALQVLKRDKKDDLVQLCESHKQESTMTTVVAGNGTMDDGDFKSINKDSTHGLDADETTVVSTGVAKSEETSHERQTPQVPTKQMSGSVASEEVRCSSTTDRASANAESATNTSSEVAVTTPQQQPAADDHAADAVVPQSGNRDGVCSRTAKPKHRRKEQSSKAQHPEELHPLKVAAKAPCVDHDDDLSSDTTTTPPLCSFATAGSSGDNGDTTSSSLRQKEKHKKKKKHHSTKKSKQTGSSLSSLETHAENSRSRSSGIAATEGVHQISPDLNEDV